MRPPDQLEAIAPANEEAIEAWNGVLFDRLVQFREIVRPASTWIVGARVPEELA